MNNNINKRNGAFRRFIRVMVYLRQFWFLLFFALAIFIGMEIGSIDGVDESKIAENTEAHDHEEEVDETWTCSMHPQIRQPEPGLCPICNMDLIPLSEMEGVESDNPRVISLSESAKALAEIQTSKVLRRIAVKKVRMFGKVMHDETRITQITSWVPGRIEKLYYNFTGVNVPKNSDMVEIYSPDLMSAEQELLQALETLEVIKKSGDKQSVEIAQSNLSSAREKLRLYGLTENQIENIQKYKKASDKLVLKSSSKGIVTKKNAFEGMYVKIGTLIFEVSDLSVVWVDLQAYESDMTWLRYGQTVEFSTDSYPGKIFYGKIAFINPILDEKTRTVNVRVNVQNGDYLLKPGMFAEGVLKVKPLTDDKVYSPELKGMWISPVHPEYITDKPGKCIYCGAELVPAEQLGYITNTKDIKLPLMIPVSAPLITGKRAVVYVEVSDTEKPTYEGRLVNLGAKVDDYYIVKSGLLEGENVVTNGNFKIDSALQILAKTSMMSHEIIDAPKPFVDSLTPTIKKYLELQVNLSQDNFDEAINSIKKLHNSINEVEEKSLRGKAEDKWSEIRSLLQSKTISAASSENIASLRTNFEFISDAIIELIDVFGVKVDFDLVEVRCPMAFDNRGANWIQTSTDIANPYFGSAMYSCGEKLRTFSSGE